MPGTSGIRIGRIALATIAGELTPILLLVVVVLIYATSGVDPQTRQAFAERVGMWLGPIAGAARASNIAPLFLGLAHDNPHITPAVQLRFDCCIEVTAS